MKRACKNCAYFKAYYRAGDYCFWEEYEGICQKSGDNVNRDQNCEFWAVPPDPPKITVELIDKAIADVQFVLNYFIIR